MVKIVAKTATELVDALKGHPIALPLVIINLMCIGVVLYTLYVVAARSAERDKLLVDIIKECNVK
jgi:hypothetical protein